MKLKHKDITLVLRFLMIALFVAFTVSSALLPTPAKAEQQNLSEGQVFKQIHIWDHQTKKFLSPEQLKRKILSANFLLLGETHDNGQHHLIQAFLLDHLARNSTQSNHTRPSVVMEMVRTSQMSIYDKFLKSGHANASQMGKALSWELEGWPKWELYQPIGQVMLDNKLDLYPGLPSMSTIRLVIKKGLKVLPPQTLQQLTLTTPLPETEQKGLNETIAVAHCNKLPPDIIAPMAQVQRFKDSYMADVMIEAARDVANPQIVLIAGSGHTRTDWGVPWYLNQRKAKGSILSIAMMETDRFEIDYLKEKAQAISGDVVIFTKAVKRPDPCRVFDKMKKAPKK